MPTNFSGNLLRIVASLTNTKIGDWFINPFVLKMLGIEKLRKVHMDQVCATFYPVIVDDRLSVSYEGKFQTLSSVNFIALLICRTV